MDRFERNPLYPRRSFLQKSFFSLGSLSTIRAHGLALASPNDSPVKGKAVADREKIGMENMSKPISGHEALPFRVFDANLCCPSDEIRGRELKDGPQWIRQLYPITKSFNEFMAYLDQTGVQRGIISSVRSQKAISPTDFIAGNREVARSIEKYKGRFLGACVVNPLFIDEALKEIEYCRRNLGFNWVGELYNKVTPYSYTIDEFELLVHQVAKLNMVLSVHTDLPEMYHIIHKFPEATVVFPEFSDSDPFARIELIAAHSNTYIDTSGYGHDRMGLLEYAVKTIGDDRILFGSAFTLNCPTTVMGRIQNAFLTYEQKQKILSGNLEGLLRKLNKESSILAIPRS